VTRQQFLWGKRQTIKSKAWTFCNGILKDVPPWKLEELWIDFLNAVNKQPPSDLT
jgi:hypothetical protein